jgi:hypothetical protein
MDANWRSNRSLTAALTQQPFHTLHPILIRGPVLASMVWNTHFLKLLYVCGLKARSWSQLHAESRQHPTGMKSMSNAYLHKPER